MGTENEGAGEASAASASDPKKDALYEDRPTSKKIIRVVTVVAYMVSVSFVAIVLSAYYVFLWQPPNPRLLHRDHLRADPQVEYLVDKPPTEVVINESLSEAEIRDKVNVFREEILRTRGVNISFQPQAQRLSVKTNNSKVTEVERGGLKNGTEGYDLHMQINPGVRAFLGTTETMTNQITRGPSTDVYENVDGAMKDSVVGDNLRGSRVVMEIEEKNASDSATDSSSSSSSFPSSSSSSSSSPSSSSSSSSSPSSSSSSSSSSSNSSSSYSPSSSSSSSSSSPSSSSFSPSPSSSLSNSSSSSSSSLSNFSSSSSSSRSNSSSSSSSTLSNSSLSNSSSSSSSLSNSSSSSSSSSSLPNSSSSSSDSSPLSSFSSSSSLPESENKLYNASINDIVSPTATVFATGDSRKFSSVAGASIKGITPSRAYKLLESLGSTKAALDYTGSSGVDQHVDDTTIGISGIPEKNAERNVGSFGESRTPQILQSLKNNITTSGRRREDLPEVLKSATDSTNEMGSHITRLSTQSPTNNTELHEQLSTNFPPEKEVPIEIVPDPVEELEPVLNSAASVVPAVVQPEPEFAGSSGKKQQSKEQLTQDGDFAFI